MERVQVKGHYSKNPCPWEIHEISNEAGKGVIHHLAFSLIRDHAFAAELEILWISHGHGFLLLSHDLIVKYLYEIGVYLLLGMRKTRRDLSRTERLAALTALTHEHTHYSSRRQIHTVAGCTPTHWSICVQTEVYYVLPRLCLCHLSQIIKANSRNMLLKQTGNGHGALCLLSD